MHSDRAGVPGVALLVLLVMLTMIFIFIVNSFVPIQLETPSLWAIVSSSKSKRPFQALRTLCDTFTHSTIHTKHLY